LEYNYCACDQSGSRHVTETQEVSMTSIIPLTQCKETIVDDDDFEELSKYKWFYDGRYVARHNHSSNLKERFVIRMHVMIMKTPPGMETDHINGDGLDNRKENLRVCTRFQNSHNSKIKSCSTTGYKGVFFKGGTCEWGAKIRVGDRRIYLGWYKDIQDAARAYDIAALAYHGQFARLNFPELAKG
jgi:hypothetical protein